MKLFYISCSFDSYIGLIVHEFKMFIHIIFTRGFVRHFIGTTVAKSLFLKEKKDTRRKILEIRL